MIENGNGRDWIYLEYRDKVQSYIKSKVNSVQDVEDLLSTVFLKVYQNYSSFDEEKAAFSTWIYTITRNTVYDYFRTAKLFCELPENLPEEEEECFTLFREETLEELADALMKLNQRERDLLLFHYYKELPLKEIAPMMGFSYATAKNIHQKAIKQLRQLLKRYNK